MRLQLWQWVLLATPVGAVVTFLLVAAGWQLHEWRLSWIWAVFTLVFVGWRWLLVKWTQPAIAAVEAAMATISEELEEELESASSKVADQPADSDRAQQAEAALQDILAQARTDAAVWEDWPTFWQRCQTVVAAIARIYHPEVKYPLLNIYVPQAYSLIRGTVDDMDRWMQQLSPALSQVTVGQAYQAYEVYRQLEPSARKLWQVWNWAQWVLNPLAALAQRASQPYSDRANQQLLANLNQLLREAALRNLCRQAIALYSNTAPPVLETASPSATLPKAKTQTLADILAQAEPTEPVEQTPVSILLAGRTGSGKSSLINTLFQAELAEVDVLPSTDRVQNYHWQTPTGETLTLWDTPGYEQANRADFREWVLDCAANADLLLLVTPVLDPSLQMDVDFLKDMRANVEDLPAIAVVTQVDRLRPLWEWSPPYDWETGERPKEIAIREATAYRVEQLGEFCDWVFPLVTGETQAGRIAWGADRLSLALMEAIAPAKQLRLSRFLRDREARSVAAARIIDRYTFQMATSQGLTALLKSPVLQFISTLTTGSPVLAYLLAEKIPVEQLPVVLGKLQMAYDLFMLLKAEDANPLNFDLIALWPLLLENSAAPDGNAWAFGHVLVEYWSKGLTASDLRERFEYYLKTRQGTHEAS